MTAFYRPLTFLLTGCAWLMLSSLLGLALLIGLVRGSGLPPWIRLVHVHAALVGGVAQMIMGAMLSFIPPLLMTGHKRRDSHPVLFWLVNAGALGVIAGFALQIPAVIGGGGLLVLAAFTGVARDAWRQSRQSLNAPPLNLLFYAVAIAALVAGLLLGIGMAVRLVDPSWYGHARLVHLHLNLLGFVTLTIVGTMHNLLPTVLQQPLYSPRSARLVFVLLPVSVVILVTGFALSSLTIELVAGALLLTGTVLYAFNLFATWRRSTHEGNAASDHLLVATFFLVLAVIMGLLVGVNYTGEAPLMPMGTLHLVAYTHLALIGFVLQTIFGALSHLVPITLAVSRVPNTKKRSPYLARLSRIMDRWRFVQITSLSLGTMGLAVIASLAWTTPLGSPAIQTSAWATFGLLLAAITLFALKLTWALHTRPESQPTDGTR
ncbi:MAG TPA: cbb3-type cytochrome c oxidase subunit I [Nitrospira sp.]|nr:cbb3-type cytochrome c oxidase subunit I [Nitrospira sp.]